MRYAKSEIDALFDYGVHIPTRFLYLGGSVEGIDGDAAELFHCGLHLLTTANLNPISVLINNPGGEWEAGIGIYDAISVCKAHVTGRVFGHASSMASLILQACDQRVMSHHSMMLAHWGSEHMEGHCQEVLEQAQYAKRANDMMIDIYLSRIRDKKPKFKREQLMDMLKFGHYFSAVEAVQFGLADEVVGG